MPVPSANAPKPEPASVVTALGGAEGGGSGGGGEGGGEKEAATAAKPLRGDGGFLEAETAAAKANT